MGIRKDEIVILRGAEPLVDVRLAHDLLHEVGSGELDQLPLGGVAVGRVEQTRGQVVDGTAAVGQDDLR